MKQTKTMFRTFSVAAWEKEQDFLSAQHRKGWKFTHVSAFCFYHFEACEPEEVVYQLDYNPEAAGNREDYLAMFRDCGWEYLQDSADYSYFRKAKKDMRGQTEEIFCDEASRIEMLRRVFQGRLLPLLILFCAVLIPQIFIQSSQGHTVLVVVYAVLIAVYLLIFLSFGLNFAKHAAKLK